MGDLKFLEVGQFYDGQFYNLKVGRFRDLRYAAILLPCVGAL